MKKKTNKKNIKKISIKSNQDSSINLNEIKKLLEKKKREILKNIKIQSEYETTTEREIGDEIDDVVKTIEKELKFDVSSNEKNILKEIDSALKKIENGSYGICELCKNPIEKKRLIAIPYSRYCLTCQKKQHSF
ncbi:MAG: TraR/DksA family transcriptional regulator [Elusimicrobiales bacterium]